MNTLRVLRPFSIAYNYMIRAWGKLVKEPYNKSRLGYCGKSVSIRNPRNVSSLSNVYMYDNTDLGDGFVFMSHGIFTWQAKEETSSANIRRVSFLTCLTVLFIPLSLREGRLKLQRISRTSPDLNRVVLMR